MGEPTEMSRLCLDMYNYDSSPITPITTITVGSHPRDGVADLITGDTSNKGTLTAEGFVLSRLLPLVVYIDQEYVEVQRRT